MSVRIVLVCAAVLLAALALSACGSADTPAGGPRAEDTGPSSAHRMEFSLRKLGASVEEETVGFLQRKGSALRVSLRRFLGPKLTTKVEPGSAVCRSGGETASISDPREFPFACIVGASADGQGLEVGITLGFVGTEVDGRCWRAANERVAVTTTAPALLSRREAMRPVNRIAGCA